MRKTTIFLTIVLEGLLLTAVWMGDANEASAQTFDDQKVVTDPQARYLTMNMGMPSNAVRNIVQDKDGFMWFGTDNGLCRYDGYSVQTFFNPDLGLEQYVSALVACDEGLLVGTSQGAYLLSFSGRNFQPLYEKIKTTVNHITVDGERNAWISTEGQGVFRYNLVNHECVNYSLKSLHGKVATTLVDANNQVWVMSKKKNGGLMRLNKTSDTFERVKLQGDATSLTGMAMLAQPDGSILVGTWDQGLYQVQPNGMVKMLLSQQLTGSLKHIHKLYNDRGLYVLIGSDEGLVEYDLQNQSWRQLSEVNNPSRSTAERFVYGIMGDQEGGLWVGTFYGGVNYIPSYNFENRFSAYAASYGGLRGNVVSRFAEDAHHRIWIATDDGGLDCFDPASNQFVNYPGRSVMGLYNTHGLLAEGDDLWVGTYGNGIIRLNTLMGAMQTYETDGLQDGSSCYCLFRDKKHRFWASSMERVNLWDEQRQMFCPVGPVKSCVLDIDEDRHGNVWFATQGSGLWCYRSNNTWKQYKHIEGDTTSVSSNHVNCVAMGSRGVMYVATSDGLCEYQPATDNFRRIDVGLSSRDFSCVLAYQGELWLSGAKGIVKYMPGEQPLLFNHYDGLTADMFLPNSGMMASDGRIYFGTPEGFNCFYPYQVKINSVQPPVAITSFELINYEKNQPKGEAGGDENANSFPSVLNHVQEIGLDYDENMFRITFSALSYMSPEKNLYRYMLEGLDEDWKLSHDHRATYTNLPPGTYTFRVRAANNDGVWSKDEATLKIVVSPPFWWSLPAKILYLFILGYLIYWVMRSRLRREERRHQLQMERMEIKQEREMRDARLRFFTMIAHEIRTPVTLIIGPLENLKEQWRQAYEAFMAKYGERLSKPEEELGVEMNKTLDVIDRNAQRLLLLVNQLLDFSKVQQESMKVHFQLQSVGKLLHAVAERFETSLRQHGIRFEVDYPAEDFSAMLDSEAITKVVSNLITNADKYTKDSVRLSCRLVDNDHFAIEVKDNGMGVSKDEQEKIFGAFYQARDNKPGTGIGLNIVKNLVDAHHGSVEVESEPGEGSLFRVTLPLNQSDALVEKADETILVPQLDDDDQADDAVEGAVDDAVEGVAADGRASAEGIAAEKLLKANVQPTLLIVEDDEDMRQFVKSHFEKTYQVLTAGDGMEALRILENYEVTMIISDWMMPEMDGEELCRRVRQNPRISHLPFVMLTAKTDDASKTEGINCGADIFIEKPFSMKYLEANVRHLLDMRRLLLAKFSSTPLEPITEIAPSKADNKFLEKMTQIIEENMNNPELNVAFLAGKLGMSRSSLFLKIRGLADVTPNEMIMLVKLKRGARLLKEGKYKVSEVSYMCGFSSPSYFSRCFQKQFGLKPGDF